MNLSAWHRIPISGSVLSGRDHIKVGDSLLIARLVMNRGCSASEFQSIYSVYVADDSFDSRTSRCNGGTSYNIIFKGIQDEE